ncbi:MAG: metallophosphoesterase, partial [Blastocatellia bacterium]
TLKFIYNDSVFTLAGVICLEYAYFNDPQRLIVNDSEIRIKNWNPAFDGFRIALISDIHGGSHGVDEAKLRDVVGKINEQDADVVVLLGDYVSQTSQSKPIRERSLNMQISVITENLKGIRAKYGVFAVLGNHDGWFDNKQVASGLRSAGITVLENEVAFIEMNGQKLRLFGMKDHLHMGTWQTFDGDMRRAVANYEQVGDLVVLQHSPDVFPVLNAFKTLGDDFKLMLAGHTHGGQIWLPVLGRPMIPSSFGQKYAAGHVNENGKDMFVTTGIGTSILPIRFMTPPEIAVLTILSE